MPYQYGIKNAPCITNPPEYLNKLVDDFNQEMSAILDTHAPMNFRTVKMRPKNEWFDDDAFRRQTNKKTQRAQVAENAL